MGCLERCREKLGKGEIYSLKEQKRLLKALKCDLADFSEVGRVLTDAGYEKYDAWEELESHFATFVGNGKTCYLTLHRKNGVLRLVEDKQENLPPVNAETGGLCAPLVTQMRLCYYAYDCGMLYLIRLGDGRFAVIDGGMAEFEETEHFLELLQTQNVREGVPEIAVWFLTHPHSDHFTLLTDLTKRYRDAFRLDTLVYNWAEAEYSSAGSDRTEFDRMLATLDGVRILPEHTGQRFCYSGVTFRILYTHEDMCPNYLRNVNDTSLVMRADFGQRRVLWTGDAMRETADLLCEQYAPEVLRCNVLQVAHHGYWGGSDALYRTVDPEVVLWPCPDFWFQALHKEECNRYLTESPNVKALFLSGQQEITLNMEAELLPVDPYALQNAAKPGELLLSEDFSGGNIYSLGWTGVTGGKTGYRSAALSLEESGCRMTAWPEQYSVCELMQPGALCMAESFTVRLVGFAERVGTAAMFWNYATPTVYCEEEALDLGLCAGEEFDLQLMVDGTAKRVSLQKNGKELHQAEFTPATQRGLYLILKDSEIVLHSVQVTR